MDDIGEMHDYLKKFPNAWISSAQQFKRAYDLVALQNDNDSATARKYPKKDRESKMPVPLWGVDVYLIGVAIENLLKGILQAKGQSFEQVLNFGHRIKDLYCACCIECGLYPQPNEIEILDVLTEFVLWAGRYALPSKAKYLENKRWLLHVNAYGYGPIVYLTGQNVEEFEFPNADKKLISSIYERFFNYLALGYVPKKRKLLHRTQYLLSS
jgi:hypothetical protein